MQTKTNLGKLKERIFVTRALMCTLAATGIFILGFIIAPALIAEANATRALGEIDWESVSLTLDPDVEATAAGGSIEDEGHGDVDFGIITPSYSSDGNQGTMKVKKKTIGVTTSGKYYTIYLSTTSSSNGLNLVTTVNGESTTNTAYNIPAIASEWSDPTSFGNYASWGFAVPGTTITTEEEISGQTVHHPSFPVPSLIDEQIFPSSDSAAAQQTYNNTVWAPVATTAAPQQIWKAETNDPDGFGGEDGDDEKDHFDIYYGLMVNTDVLAGTYENNIVYTALASTTSLDRVSSNIHHSKSFGGKGDEVKIRFDLKDSTNSVTRSMVHVAMIPHSIMASHYDSTTSAYDVNNLTFSDYNECVVTSLTHPTGEDAHKYIDLTCNMPAGEEGSQYDFWVNVNGYNYNYVSKTMVGEGASAQLAASFTYAGLQTKWPTTDPRYDSNAADPLDNLVVKNMQDMTNGICNLTNAWGNTTSVDAGSGTVEKSALGQYARIYNYSMSARVVDDIMMTDPEDSTKQIVDHEATALASDALGVGTFALTDIRDNKAYLVRRLADGYCWMVQDLDLELADYAGHNLSNTQDPNKVLTSANTDLASSGRTYWDPSESTNQKIADNNVLPVAGETLFSTFLHSMTGISTSVKNSEQFQSYDLAGIDHSWGSKCSGFDDCDLTADFTNRVTSAMPRSYSNTVTSDQSTDFASATQFRYIPTNWKTGQTRSQNMNATTGYPTANPTHFGEGATDSVTATATYMPTTRATSATGSAGATYESSADNSYYGNMYIGHYYSWFAATAETGTFRITDPKEYDDSICPAGWRLPLTSAGVKNDPSFYRLYANKYHIINNTGDQTDDNAPQGTAFGPTTDMHKIPLSIPFMGRYNFADGVLEGRGTIGRLASSMKYASKAGVNYYTSFGSKTIQASIQGTSMYGEAIRCVARGTESRSQESQDVNTCPGGNICYDANGGTGTMDNQTASANASVTLNIPTFNRLGYSFAGWGDQENGFGKVYGPNEIITTPSNLATEGLRLYAKWLPSSGTMQAFTDAQCDALSIHQPIALTDSRDGKTYTVTKLRDGNCWMTTNLALNLADFAGDNPKSGYLTMENTDIPDNRSDLVDVPSSSGSGTTKRWDPSLSMLRKAVSIQCPNVANPNTMTSAQLLAACPDITTGTDNDYLNGNYFTIASTNLLGQEQDKQFYAVGQTTGYRWTTTCSAVGVCDPDATPTAESSLTQMPRAYSKGNDTDIRGHNYNWYAATAESGYYNMTSATYLNASASICPSGWRMPKGLASGANDSFSNLIRTVYEYIPDNGSGNINGKKQLISLPMAFTYIYGNEANGNYWSRTRYGTGAPAEARYFTFHEGIVHTTYHAYKTAGYAIRCIIGTGNPIPDDPNPEDPDNPEPDPDDLDDPDDPDPGE